MLTMPSMQDIQSSHYTAYVSLSFVANADRRPPRLTFGFLLGDPVSSSNACLVGAGDEVVEALVDDDGEEVPLSDLAGEGPFNLNLILSAGCAMDKKFMYAKEKRTK